MKIVICAAGLGSRMGQLTKDCPKPLLPLGKKTIIENLIDKIVTTNKVEEIVIVLGYRGDQIRNKLGTKRKNIKLRYVYNEDFLRTNNVYSLSLAKDFIDRELVYLNADLVIDQEAISDFLINASLNSALTDLYKPNMYIDPNDPVKIHIDDNFHIVDMDKLMKPDSICGVAIGVYKFSPIAKAQYFSTANKLASLGKKLTNEGLIKVLIKDFGLKLYAHQIRGRYWFDLDLPDEYYQSRKYLQNAEYQASLPL